VSFGEVVLSAAVEGIVDQAVVERLSDELGFSVYSFHGLKGKSYLKERIKAFNSAARFNPWLVLVDLDSGECAPKLRSDWLTTPSRLMRFRVAVRAIETWLMADADTLSDFLHVRRAFLPANPDALENPKQSLVDLARRSNRAELRKDMVPRTGSGNNIGPAYSSRLIEYVSDHSNGWRPNQAARVSDSLRRCWASLQTLAAMPTSG
jgi:hypothetical protein